MSLYKNTKTGVVIDCPSKIKGKYWIDVKDIKKEPEKAEKIELKEEIKEPVKKEEKYVRADLEKLTNADLKEILDEEEISYSKSDKKDILIEKILKL